MITLLLYAKFMKITIKNTKLFDFDAYISHFYIK
jgi:hypothetical protein